MADLGQSHPELAARYNRLVTLCWERAWYVGITSSTRTYAEQADLYRAYKNDPTHANQAANPDTSIYTSPWGWPVKGSFHMVQEDGYSHALDLHWQQCTPVQLQQAANLVGLRLTVVGENWHFQWWDANGVFAKPIPDPLPPASKDDDDMVPTILKAEPRPGVANTYDFTYLPASATFGGVVVDTAIYVRREQPDKLATQVQVYQQGAESTVDLPADGTTVKVNVTKEGLTSLVGVGGPVEAEAWVMYTKP